MGPAALFDKSFIQGLNVDQSVWFDRFFIPVVCPIFFVETLGDLAKEPKNRTAEEEVKTIASKFPEVQGVPCMNHLEMGIASLLGEDIPMDGHIMLPGGRHVKGGGKSGVVYGQSLEAATFQRWQRQQFHDAERLGAKQWRQSLADMDLKTLKDAVTAAGLDLSGCTTLAEAKRLADIAIDHEEKAFDVIRAAVMFFQIPQHLHAQTIQRWIAKGKPSLRKYAPYAAHILNVEMFFSIAVTKGLIASERNSNRTDIAYLFYLPFCHVFVSGDKLHAKTAPLFMRTDQEYVAAADLKADLKKLNDHYLALPEEVRDQGLFKLAPHPPLSGGFLVTELWERHNYGYALRDDEEIVQSPEAEKKLVEELKAFAEGQPMTSDEIASGDDENYAVSLERKIHHKKGSWFQMPKDIKKE